MTQVLTFTVDGTRFGLPVQAVEAVLAAQSIVHLPHVPAVVLGVVAFGGQAVAAISLRWRLGLAERAPAPSDRLIVAHAGQHAVALHVDMLGGVIDYRDGEIVVSERDAHGVGHVAGVALLDDGLLLIQDLGMALSVEEHGALQHLLSAQHENSRRARRLDAEPDGTR